MLLQITLEIETATAKVTVGVAADLMIIVVNETTNDLEIVEAVETTIENALEGEMSATKRMQHLAMREEILRPVQVSLCHSLG